MIEHLEARAARFSRRRNDGRRTKQGHVSGNPRYDRNAKHESRKDRSMGRN